MKTFLIALLAAASMTVTLLPETAEAKRFGGGKSFGKQYSMPQQNAAPRQANQNTSQARPQAAAGQRAAGSGASRWLGPLAGLAAGGLLASLFFGDAFSGLQVMDFLMIAVLIFGGLMLFRLLRQKGARPAPAVAGMPGAARTTERDFGGASGGMAGGGESPRQPTGPSLGGLGGQRDGQHAAQAPETLREQMPQWFDAEGFVEGAKTHFIRLQAAWDAADFRDIREYTTPQLFAEIKREREALGDAPNYTEVVRLDAELLSVRRDLDQVVVSLRFTGLIRESENAPADPLDEIWHVSHDWATAEGDWLISGIQQQDH